MIRFAIVNNEKRFYNAFNASNVEARINKNRIIYTVKTGYILQVKENPMFDYIEALTEQAFDNERQALEYAYMLMRSIESMSDYRDVEDTLSTIDSINATLARKSA